MSVKIGKNYWIGNSSTNLKGVKLVDNVTVALNSVITKSSPSNCLIGSCPAPLINKI